MSPAEKRLVLGVAAILSEAEAVRLLPFCDKNCRDWLRENGLVHERAELGRYVIWGEVVEALAAEARRPKSAPAPSGRLPRGGLTRPDGR